MKEEKIFGMLFAKVYPLLVAKVEKKGVPKLSLMRLPAGLQDTA